MNQTIGSRIYGYAGAGIPKVGEYGKDDRNDEWFAMCPSEKRLLANLSAHEVIEHEDGTITVSPSILVTGHDGQWHGYLERGVWREV